MTRVPQNQTIPVSSLMNFQKRAKRDNPDPNDTEYMSTSTGSNRIRFHSPPNQSPQGYTSDDEGGESSADILSEYIG